MFTKMWKRSERGPYEHQQVGAVESYLRLGLKQNGCKLLIIVKAGAEVTIPASSYLSLVVSWWEIRTPFCADDFPTA